MEDLARNYLGNIERKPKPATIATLGRFPYETILAEQEAFKADNGLPVIQSVYRYCDTLIKRTDDICSQLVVSPFSMSDAGARALVRNVFVADELPRECLYDISTVKRGIVAAKTGAKIAVNQLVSRQMDVLQDVETMKNDIAALYDPDAIVLFVADVDPFMLKYGPRLLSPYTSAFLWTPPQPDESLEKHRVALKSFLTRANGPYDDKKKNRVVILPLVNYLNLSYRQTLSMQHSLVLVMQTLQSLFDDTGLKQVSCHVIPWFVTTAAASFVHERFRTLSESLGDGKIHGIFHRRLKSLTPVFADAILEQEISTPGEYLALAEDVSRQKKITLAFQPFLAPVRIPSTIDEMEYLPLDFLKQHTDVGPYIHLLPYFAQSVNPQATGDAHVAALKPLTKVREEALGGIFHNFGYVPVQRDIRKVLLDPIRYAYLTGGKMEIVEVRGTKRPAEEILEEPVPKEARLKCIVCTQPALFACPCDSAVYCTTKCQEEHFTTHCEECDCTEEENCTTHCEECDCTEDED